MDEPADLVLDDTTGTIHVQIPLALSQRLTQQDQLQLGSCVDVTGTVSFMPSTAPKALQIDATS
jgi:aspartyl/asparaginyl-tRNA synthetase